MKNIIKLLLVSILLTFSFSVNVSWVSAASYTNIVPADHQEYQWWATLLEKVVTPYVDSKNSEQEKINLWELEIKIAEMFIKYGGWGCHHKECDPEEKAKSMKLAYFRGNRLIVWCGNLDLLSYKIITPTPWSCLKLDVTSSWVFSCTWNSTAKNYRIYVNSKKISNNKSGNYNVSNVWTYNFECRVDNETSAKNSCKKTIKTLPTPDCTNLTIDVDNKKAVCTWTNTNKYNLYIGNTKISTNTTGVFQSNIIAQVMPNPWTYNFSCRVDGESTADNECKETVTVTEPEYDLALRKTVTSDAPYNIGDIVTYNIAVINQGWIDANKIEITDYIPTNMELVSWNGWSAMTNDRKVTKVISSLAKWTTKNLTIKLKILSWATGTITNYAEISGDDWDDCDSTPDNNKDNDWTVIDDNIWNGCNPGWDEDDHDPASIIIGWVFDLALRKTTETGWPYNIGDTIRYKIEVFNQGTLEGKNIEITDYIPTNMEFVASAGWSTPVNWKTVNNTITSIAAWATKELFINLKIKAWVADWSSITNYAEISEDHATDCDSIADDDKDNDGTVTDNDIWNGCNSGWDEDDHDLEEIFIGSVCSATITWIQSSPISETTSWLCKISWQTVGDFVTNVVGRTAHYTWTCNTANEKYSGWNCSARYTRSWGWWGSSAVCLDIIDKWSNKYTCIWDKDTKMIWIDCDGDGKYEQVKYSSNRSAFIEVNGTYQYTFTCNTVDADWNSTVDNPRCAVEKHKINANQSSGWNTSLACKMQTISCWNGKIEWNEECEKTDTNGDGKIDYRDNFPNFCTNSCKLRWGWSWTTPGANWNLFTTPNEGKFTFEWGYDVIMWGNKTLDTTGKLSSIKVINTSDYTFGHWVITWVCIAKDRQNLTKWDEILTSLYYTYSKTKICSPLSGKYYIDQEIILNENILKEFKSHLNFTWDFNDNNMVVTISTNKDMWNYSDILNWSEHMSDKFKVRVAKPAVQSTSWTRYTTSIDSSVNTKAVASNINTQQDYSETSDNDVWVWTQSSSANTTDDTQIVEDASEYNTDSNIIDTTTSTSFEKYNGLDNVFIKSGDTNISDIMDNYTIDKPMTFIIDNWDLTIDENVYASHNIAFVVKNGNIIVDNSVIEIKWTYIVLWNWKIKSDWTNTDNVLTVKGSLYGNIDDLVTHRTNVKEQNGELTFGTVVSFGSSVFQKPAPMVTSFVNDYLKTNKVAR